MTAVLDGRLGSDEALRRGQARADAVLRSRRGGRMVDEADRALLAEQHRPRGSEHWARMAKFLDQREAGFRLAADGAEVAQGRYAELVARAMRLAADADADQARLLRQRLARVMRLAADVDVQQGRLLRQRVLVVTT